MRTVALEDMGEYSARLVSYLERHLSSDVHIVSCSDPKQLSSQVPKDACCIGQAEYLSCVGEEFQQKITISTQQMPGQFCIFRSPKELIPMIEEHLSPAFARELTSIRDTSITAVFMPIFEPRFEEIAIHLMEAGDLCLGMENLGPATGEYGDMGDLCYYIHLRKESLTEEIMELSREKNARYFIDSPDLYYDLLELEQEDLTWFFDKIREGNISPGVYVALGSGMAGNVDIFRHFDRIIVINSTEDLRLQRFCQRFDQMLEAKDILPRGGVEYLEKEFFLK